MIFLIFFLFFSKFSCPGRVGTEFGTKIFFPSFLVYLLPFWLKLMPKRGFFNFFNFFAIFFRNFLPRAEDERNSGLKFFSLFLGLSRPVLAKNNAGKREKKFSLEFRSYSTRQENSKKNSKKIRNIKKPHSGIIFCPKLDEIGQGREKTILVQNFVPTRPGL